jgi:hypothetical protein
MTGFNNNNKFIPQTQTYEVKYVESKQKGLSPTARQKVIQKHGSHYQSQRLNEINPGYGPMPNGHGCPQRSGYEIIISLTGEYAFKQGGGTFPSCKLCGEIMDLSNARS